jgi:ABC-type transport system involved in cytochrome c biogenesis permease subunit
MIATPLPPELPWLWAAAAAFGVAAWQAVAPLLAASRLTATPGRAPRHMNLSWALALALACTAIGIALRWLRLGHGPFLDMFEILASSLLSLGLVVAWALRRDPLQQVTAPVVLPLLAVMALWLLTTDAADTHFPPTYDTPVLWFHVLLGKLFLGCALLGLGVAGIVLLRATRLGAHALAQAPADAVLDARAWRLMRIALVFESLMLITGAVWAQDAWGRWWAWDPLETWAFLTWLLLSGALHARQSWRIGPRGGAWLIVAVFVLAFLTFFGVPFVSVAPHKGAV